MQSPNILLSNNFTTPAMFYDGLDSNPPMREESPMSHNRMSVILVAEIVMRADKIIAVYVLSNYEV